MRAEDFLKSIVADPNNISVRFAYSDWLQEEGDDQWDWTLGNFVRVSTMHENEPEWIFESHPMSERRWHSKSPEERRRRQQTWVETDPERRMGVITHPVANQKKKELAKQCSDLFRDLDFNNTGGARYTFRAGLIIGVECMPSWLNGIVVDQCKRHPIRTITLMDWQGMERSLPRPFLELLPYMMRLNVPCNVFPDRVLTVFGGRLEVKFGNPRPHAMLKTTSPADDFYEYCLAMQRSQRDIEDDLASAMRNGIHVSLQDVRDAHGLPN